MEVIYNMFMKVLLYLQSDVRNVTIFPSSRNFTNKFYLLETQNIRKYKNDNISFLFTGFIVLSSGFLLFQFM